MFANVQAYVGECSGNAVLLVQVPGLYWLLSVSRLTVEPPDPWPVASPGWHSGHYTGFISHYPRCVHMYIWYKYKLHEHEWMNFDYDTDL